MFYSNVSNLPYRDDKEVTPHFYDFFVNTPGSLLPPKWSKWVPAWSQQVILGQTIWHNADLSYANLSQASLYRANLDGAILFRANLSTGINNNYINTDLREASLKNVDLSYANLTGALLMNADLTGADLTGTILDNANLTGAIMPDGMISKP